MLFVMETMKAFRLHLLADVIYGCFLDAEIHSFLEPCLCNLHFIKTLCAVQLGIYVLAFCETLEFYLNKQTFHGSSHHNMHHLILPYWFGELGVKGGLSPRPLSFSNSSESSNISDNFIQQHLQWNVLQSILFGS